MWLYLVHDRTFTRSFFHSFILPVHSILEHRPLTNWLSPISSAPGPGFYLYPGLSLRLDKTLCIPPPAVTRPHSPSLILWVPQESMPRNAVSWSSQCTAVFRVISCNHSKDVHVLWVWSDVALSPKCFRPPLS